MTEASVEAVKNVQKCLNDDLTSTQLAVCISRPPLFLYDRSLNFSGAPQKCSITPCFTCGAADSTVKDKRLVGVKF